MHTNPILISFCSILYYKHLDEYVKQYVKEKMKIEKDLKGVVVELKKFDGRRLPRNNTNPKNEPKNNPKTYCKIIVNRWHLLIKLEQNRILLRYRKNNKSFNFQRIFEKKISLIENQIQL